MEANAPEKLYLIQHNGLICYCRNNDDDIEYVRTDALTEKADVEEEFERPNIKVKDAIEVSSRMKYIDEDLKPIADFIMDYCSWNLHKDECNQPTIEVPLFRVLDALVQRGKPYCQDTTPAKE